jgi:HAE1 family hydrophobic/amphiphilic exporter-1
MKISHHAVNRPIFTIMVTLIVITIGGISLSRLSVDLMPDISYPTLSVSTTFENAGPEEVEDLITRPIEEAMSAVPGVEEVTSVSAEGQSSVRISFGWGTDLDEAANDIRDRLDRITSRLPDDAESPRLRKFDLAAFPILILGVSGDQDPVQLRNLIENQVKNRIERVPGVASLSIRGGLTREIQVNLNPEKIKALGLALDRIVSRIKEENITQPVGSIEQGQFKITLRVPGTYTRLTDLANTVVAIRDGMAIQLKEIAAIEDTWEKVTRIVRVNGKTGMRLSINKQAGKNTVEVATRALAEIDRINRDIPQLEIIPIINSSEYIRQSITNVGNTVLYGGILAILVVFFFLRNLAGTGIIATTIPISIIATFALIYFGGFTLNLMTLGGLALGVGMLIDNSIVVLENIYRLRKTGLDPKTAAIRGSEEVTAAVIASTLTTLAVFLPLIFMRGMSGVMFKQFSYVVAFSLSSSLLTALTLVPMLAAHDRGSQRNIKHPPEKSTPETGMNRTRAGLFSKVEDGYKNFLKFSLNHRFGILFIVISAVVGSLFLIPLIGVEMMPAADEGEVRVDAEMAVGTRLELMDRIFSKVEEIAIRSVPELANTVSTIGGRSWHGGGGNSAQLRISLKPQKERHKSSEEIAGELRGKLTNIPGAKIRTRVGRGFFMLRMGSGGEDRLQLEIRGHDPKIAKALAERVENVLQKIEGVTDTRISRDAGTPEELIIVDRQKAADMKLSVSSVAKILQTMISGSSASNYREGGNEYRIRIQVAGIDKMDLEDILDLPVTNSDGLPVILRNVVEIRRKLGPLSIERKDQERVVYVTANIAGRDMGSILTDIREQLRTVPVPKDFSIIFGGDFEEQQQAFRELLISFVLAIMLVYMVMASLYESLRDPFVVMFSVPLAIIGVVIMLFLSGTTFNIQSYIGCIMLGGIVVNNAILLVDHINLLRRRDGLSIREAVEEAGRRRLRPILMTALTTILAMTPLALGIGEGSEAQAPMARAIVGGLISSSLITLVIVPIVYSLFANKRSEKGTAI